MRMRKPGRRRQGCLIARFAAAALLIVAAFPGLSFAQSTQLRGLPQSGTSRLPSAQQQLNQNLNRQQSDFSTRQLIDSNNRRNRTDQINRQIMQPETTPSDCPGGNEACQGAR